MKFRAGWAKTRIKAQEKDASLGPDCDGAMSDAVRDSVEASALIATGRNLAAFSVNEFALADDSGVQTLIDDAVAGVDITSDNAGVAQSTCEAAGGTWDGSTCTAADITSNDAAIAAAAAQAACVEANGTWDSGTCTAAPVGSSYNCTIGAMCSAWAAAYPGALPYYTNKHVDHTAASSGCDAANWGMHAALGLSDACEYCVLPGSGIAFSSAACE